MDNESCARSTVMPDVFIRAYPGAPGQGLCRRVMCVVTVQAGRAGGKQSAEEKQEWVGGSSRDRTWPTVAGPGTAASLSVLEELFSARGSLWAWRLVKDGWAMVVSPVLIFGPVCVHESQGDSPVHSACHFSMKT